MTPTLIVNPIVATLAGFGGTIALVLAAAAAVGASPDQTASWVTSVCLAIAAISAILSVWHRQPVIAAWSTPGAALIASTAGVDMAHAAGAFLVTAALILATAAIRPLNDLVARLPAAVASGMLAGVLVQFPVAAAAAAGTDPWLVLPLFAVFLAVRLVAPTWAIPAVLAAGIGLAAAVGAADAVPGGLTAGRLTWVAPAFDAATVTGLAVPLYLVTMASQNLPGFAVLRAAGYVPRARSILAVSGLASAASALAGAHTSNLAAISAAICTGEDTHPDRAERWKAGVVYALCYLVLAGFGTAVVGLIAAMPKALIVTVAGLALIGPFTGAVVSAFEQPAGRFAAVASFAVTASGVAAFGIGSAFWGLAAGLCVLGLERLRRG